MIHFVRAARRALAGFAVASALVVGAPAHADTDYTDAWFGGAAQGGWGLAFTQNDFAIYAQFFHYDANHNPIWFGGTIYRVTDGHYNGALYVVSGDYYGHMPYDPTLFHATPVGTIDFNATDASHGDLSYTINGVTVLTQIQRLTLVNIPLQGNYIGALFQSQSAACSGGAYTVYSPMEIIVTQSGTPGNVGIEFRYTDPPYDTFCTTTGATTQDGKVFDMPVGVHACGGTTYPSLHISDLRRTANGGIEGRWETVAGNQCVDSGRFAGISEQ